MATEYHPFNSDGQPIPYCKTCGGSKGNLVNQRTAKARRELLKQRLRQHGGSYSQ
jgi:hypothetical protein